MKFWDSSALVPLIIDEPSSVEMNKLHSSDPKVTAWWGSPTECSSAICRRERLGVMEASEVERTLDRLTTVSTHWDIVQPSEALRARAGRILRVHDLRAADALQLAAALLAAESLPGSLDMVCLDARLSDAARREGFRVLSGDLDPR